RCREARPSCPATCPGGRGAGASPMRIRPSGRATGSSPSFEDLPGDGLRLVAEAPAGPAGEDRGEEPGVAARAHDEEALVPELGHHFAFARGVDAFAHALGALHQVATGPQQGGVQLSRDAGAVPTGLAI